MRHYLIWLSGGRTPEIPFMAVQAYTPGGARREVLKQYPKVTIRRILRVN